MSAHPFYIYRDERVGVRPLTIADIQGGYGRWFNDPEVCRFNQHGIYPMTTATLEKYVHALEGDQTRIVWAICDVTNERHIGNVSLQSINLVHRNAEYAIIVGEKDYWGKGFSYQASCFLLKHGFERLNLHRIYCGTAAGNLGMKKLAMALKMKEEGIRRDAMLFNGHYVDCHEFGVLRHEFLPDG
jgi:RimJ/RimL family protein N-acetyltransferase